jgi:hypothetical protein
VRLAGRKNGEGFGALILIEVVVELISLLIGRHGEFDADTHRRNHKNQDSTF